MGPSDVTGYFIACTHICTDKEMSAVLFNALILILHVYAFKKI